MAFLLDQDIPNDDVFEIAGTTVAESLLNLQVVAANVLRFNVSNCRLCLGP